MTTPELIANNKMTERNVRNLGKGDDFVIGEILS